jgi:hypothetical protein
MAVNYSAMEDHVKMPGGIPIRVEKFFRESVIETEQKRALPDNNDFVKQVNNFLRLSSGQRQELSIKTRDYMEEPTPCYGEEKLKLPRFSWDRTARIWYNIIKETKILPQNETWLSPEPKIYIPNINPPDNLNNAEFIKWTIKEILGRPDLINSFLCNEWIKNLNCGFRIEGSNRIPLDRKGAIKFFSDWANSNNAAENARVQRLGLDKNISTSQHIII